MYIHNLFSPMLAGLDVQSDAVRLVRLDKKKQKVCIAEMISVSLQPYVFNGYMVEDWDGLEAAVTELVIMAGVRKKPIVAGLTLAPGHGGKLDMAGMRNSHQMESMIRGSMNEGYLRRFVNCLHAAGLKINAVDIDICALQRLVNRVGAFHAYAYSETLVALHPQSYRTLLVVSRAGQMLFSQSWPHHAQPHEVEHAILGSGVEVDRMVIFSGEDAIAYLARLNHYFPVSVVSVFSGMIVNNEDARMLSVIEQSDYTIAAGFAMRKLHKHVN